MQSSERLAHSLKSSRRPLYTQAITALHELLQGGDYHSGDLLPSEDVLARQVGVSRATLREALGHLESYGLVTRRQGIGTFVGTPARPWFMGGLERLESYHSLAARAGMQVRAVEREVSITPADADLAGLLNLEAGAEIVRVQVVEEVSGQRGAYINTYVRPDAASAEDLAAFGGPVIDYLTQVNAKALTHTRSEILAVHAGEEVARRLDVPAGRAILHLREVFYALDGSPLAASLNYFLTDQFRFHVTRRVPHGGGEAQSSTAESGS
jgi:GntR family transcriptional regulator